MLKTTKKIEVLKYFYDQIWITQLHY
jgi:hypothetical protein